MKVPLDFTVQTEAQLREVVGSPSEALMEKILPTLEEQSRYFIQHSSIVCATTKQKNGLLHASMFGGEKGFVRSIAENSLLIPIKEDGDYMRMIENINANPFIGLLFFVQGVSETLRVNGRASIVREKELLTVHFPTDQQLVAAIQVEVEECFLHCAKAFFRSKLWDSTTYLPNYHAGMPSTGDLFLRQTILNEQMQSFMKYSPFICLGSSQMEGGADISPKGDPAGFVQIVDEHTILIPDRPGNKICDNFQNILVNPYICVLFFVPGVDQILSIQGKASIIKEEKLLEPLSIEGKCPALGIWIEIEEVTLSYSQAMVNAGLWNSVNQIDRKTFPTMGEMVMKQLAHSKYIKGMSAKAFDDMANQEYKQGLY
ncbi:pyridoxamine 5'-phosphate oxidase family protein [Brevibacillus laterosporus]|uniref:Pyridoxamine 5'-phosphate oxidase family protein n=1 Tax=Brevibacillus laterosporus TaxID=1465 RepID=A0AAP3DJP0_BRELA|nr:pyridoxamine 5'-phosphate oxidase family protein [Brevibacillus laterosporus]MCR8981100.1 pyridoxamine 5'-phosphate oxidase family protein [Brevibacillus laterosporus]MCZ0808255.1 pyridoxamine 5'-phosphate oxidase family protein [Brevibacillus laterosporus]MCZ0826614.1 pyridoxamine 5'-phosphate oxidase family protein [Brevibacillus laterosporus]MCZ0850427.1 pyridoxamine 5'-phosphate oxidase family protein [Brevibacillus laterosporus]MED1663881.1 pyridoxamine 5'-phosphate oxidase family prot